MKKNAQTKIVELSPMYAISAYAYGDGPEIAAWSKLENWALSKGLWGNLSQHPVYGFDNPPPDQKSPKYGFEFWMQINEPISPDGDLRLIFFKGGNYATMRCEVKNDPQNITKGWMSLMTWVEEHNFQIGAHQGLEKFLNGIALSKMNIELYCPIQKK